MTMRREVSEEETGTTMWVNDDSEPGVVIVGASVEPGYSRPRLNIHFGDDEGNRTFLTTIEENLQMAGFITIREDRWDPWHCRCQTRISNV